MRKTWAIVCRKANGEELVQSNDELMTRRQAIITPLGQPKFHLPEHLIPKVTPTNFDLMSLPWDLRHSILAQILPRTTFPFFLRGANGRQRTGIPFPQILLANKQLRTEALLVGLNQTEIEIHSGPGNAAFQTWLSGIDLSSLHGDISTNISTGFDAVQRLSFPYFSRFPHRRLPLDTPNADIELMRKCPQLRELKLHFAVQELWDGGVEEKSARQLVGEYRLEGLLELKSLRRIVLVRQIRGGLEGKGVQGLGEWLRGEFEKVGRKKVEVVVIA